MGMTTSQPIGLIEIDVPALRQDAGEELPLAELLARWMTRTLGRRAPRLEEAAASLGHPAPLKSTSRFQPAEQTAVVRADITGLKTQLAERESELRGQLS